MARLEDSDSRGTAFGILGLYGADKMCIIYHIYFSECDHKDALFVPCAEREPRTKECPKGDPRQVRHTQDGPCEDCQPPQGDDDPDAVVESEQEQK
ncbi:hypothetical protein B0T13DRAFT_507044 [Neurospora crassa]|nr:hypothetical protein B0T13DRAFT_507044 [Neurospora crassa]